MQLTRSSGILLHPTSLPGPYGLGSLGAEAYEFVNFLTGAGQSIWQILPLGPTGYGDSPYSAFSAFAGNPLLICLERLVEAGDLDAEALAGVDMAEGKANFGFAHSFKERLLHQAALRFREQGDPERRREYEGFCAREANWVHDYALFRALRRHFGEQTWNRWPAEIRRREDKAMRHWGDELSESIYVQKYAQFVFFKQWFDLKEYANSRGIRILGDLPIFVSYDSADVWANPESFHLDDQGRPILVSGVPPDYFSKTGQRWGNPLYRWEQMAEDDYKWWQTRFAWNLALTDMVRIDHFRGFESCWAIPAAEETAVNGHWSAVPGASLFDTLTEKMGVLPVVAEDLGLITPEVEALRERFDFPGMKVLQFAFGSGPDNPYLPHNLPRRCVLYTGTHDNDTTLGWWNSLPGHDREEVIAYLGTTGRDMPWELIRLAMASVAEICILPLQDALGLDGSARMNRPGRPSDNWSWRYRPDALTDSVRHRLAEMSRLYGRWPSDNA